VVQAFNVPNGIVNFNSDGSFFLVYSNFSAGATQNFSVTVQTNKPRLPTGILTFSAPLALAGKKYAASLAQFGPVPFLEWVTGEFP